ncbi:secreted Ly-6/uPAR-related protein 1-like [Dendropsophus ebraccatus]|uniref:secreted Ly-6/uPAR-related protein 1-like n=1 Tax=Dendropsophus ebraccatus TaxID=150705 RepID=UPI0038321067
MKVIAILLITLGMFCQQGGSIICYYCPDLTFSSECTDMRNCTGDNNVCKTTVLSPDVGFPFLGTEVVTRGCSTATTCIPDDPDSLGDDKIVFCCTSDLCNNRGLNATSSAHRAGPGGVTAGTFLMGLSVPLITMRL